jgi:hypothetical protein
MKFSNATVGKKLIWGFTAILIPLALVTVVGLRGMSVTHSDLVRVLTEDTVKRVNDGSQLVTRTNEAFREVATSSTKVAQLVCEIAAASGEQFRGIDQINKAVAEMDKVVQQNAANAEESASASEEMNAQALEMKGFVLKLVAMVSGNANGNGHSDPPSGSGYRITGSAADNGSVFRYSKEKEADAGKVFFKGGHSQRKHLAYVSNEEFEEF